MPTVQALAAGCSLLRRHFNAPKMECSRPRAGLHASKFVALLLIVALTALGCSNGRQTLARDTPAAESPSSTKAWWRPTGTPTWQWQLNDEPIDATVDAEVFDIDLFDNSAATVGSLHAQGRRVICYFTAGSWEPYRPDSHAFTPDLLGGQVEAWPDERWLDIRRVDALRPLMASRLDLCRDKGFDGVEPDWLDNHRQRTGFDITPEDQLRFNRMLADMAHERGLAIGLKNDLDQTVLLADLFDYSVVEQCVEFDECAALKPFTDRAKPVFSAEYHVTRDVACPQAERRGLSTVLKRVELDSWRETC